MSRRAARTPSRTLRPALTLPVKVTPPLLAQVYARQRLSGWLDGALAKGHVWIAGPPGAGKTTLAASHFRAYGQRMLWYQVDAGDRDPASFFHYLGLAASHAAPRYRTPLPKLTPEYLRGLSTFTRNFFRELTRRLKPPFAVVLDNLQEAGADGAFYDVLREALEELPVNGHAILLSRAQPPEAFARARLEQRLSVLNAEALRLTEQEAVELIDFLNELSPGTVPPEQARTLYLQCDGWFAGMLLLLQSALTEKPELPLEAAQQLFDYFAGEAFNRRHPAVREFLMQTALYPTFTASMAQELTGYARAPELLNELARQHNFTEQRPGPSTSYQYHPLFREFLLSKARATWEPAVVEGLQHRAAEALERSGHHEQALRAYSNAHDWGAVTRLVCALAPSWTAEGRFGPIADAIQGVPAPVVESEPWLSYWRGVCRLPIDLREALGSFETAYQLFTERRDPAGAYLAWIGAVESLAHALSDMRAMDLWFERFDRLRREYPQFPDRQIGQRVIATRFVALVLRAPQHPELSDWHAQTLDLLKQADVTPSLRVISGFYLLTYYLWCGNYRMARIACEALSTMGSGEQTAPIARVIGKMSESWFHWLMGEDQSCLTAMREGLEIAQTTGVHLWEYLTIIQGVASALNRGEFGLAEELLQRLAPSLPKARGMDKFYYFHERAWLALLQNDIPGARAYEEQALQAASQTAVVFGEAQAHYGMSQVLHECGDGAGAERHLAESRRFGALLRSDIIEFMCRLAEAQYALAGERKEPCIEHLRGALALGRTLGYVSFTWWRPQVMARLCSLALRHGIEVEYVQMMIRKRGLMPPADAIETDSWPFRIKVYTLGRFLVLIDDEPLTFSSKAQKKPLELLKALIALGGDQVREEMIADLLWPEAEASERALTAAVHRLRKLIGEHALVRQEGRLTLDRRHCWVDAWSLEKILNALEHSCRQNRADRAVSLTEGVFALYRGPFLTSEADSIWALSARERLRAKFLRHLDTAVRYLQQANKHDQALACCERALEIDPLAEGFYRGLIQSYLETERPAEALNAYERCRRILESELRVAPAPATEALVRALPRGR